MAKLVTIFGGSGFLGRHVAFDLARRGWRVRIAVRRPDEALFTRTYGHVGQVAPVLCNIRDEASVRAVLTDADAAINCVNITSPKGKSTFQTIFVDGAANVARLSREMGVERLVHVSGIGIDPDSDSKYVAAKSRGEAAVLEARPDAVVLRPSVMFGEGDSLYTKFASMARFGPVVNIAAGDTKMQPVWVGDVAQAAAIAAEGGVAPGIYQLGGPDVLTLRDIVQQALTSIDRRRLVVNQPIWLARLGAGALDMVQTVSGGLISNGILTRDQLKLLSKDNVVEDGAQGFDAFGITPTAPQAVIDDYLWRFRPSGQYETIKKSAKNLRAD
ncbi:complex I NDUFA9 subunit family protein (plasmid) [Paracoccus sp. TK19116]|uniref:Complex I NDUFA9 subunit family protein n=1 Tax=Paracoccus albicereus TaxID=2922394 RepID=A0ABT1ML49_9RHOB|nr:complex I NDUFA9 subunit family protein [Paracoccus albicereus]MCQ0969028.1 complex I NDUFA9 subunit family protein [Paracoccus albicereus]